MPSVVRTITRIQDADDFTGSLTDTYIPVYSTAQSKFVMTAQSGGGGTPGGSTTQVQYNSSGAFAGDAGMTYDAANDALTVSGRVITPVIRPASDSTTAVKIMTASGADAFVFDTTNKYLVCGGNRVSYSSLTSQPSLLFSTFEAWIYITSTRHFRFYNNGFTSTLPSTVLSLDDPNKTFTLTASAAKIISKSSDSTTARFQIQNSASTVVGDWYASAADNGLHFSNPSAASAYMDFLLNGSEKLKLTSSNVNVTGLLQCDSLRIDVTPTTETVTCTHTVTFSANGTNYKIPCVAE